MKYFLCHLLLFLFFPQSHLQAHALGWGSSSAFEMVDPVLQKALPNSFNEEKDEALFLLKDKKEPTKLPLFKPSFSHQEKNPFFRPLAQRDRPWLDSEQRALFNILDEQDLHRLSLFLMTYVYDGFLEDPSKDFHFIPQRNNKRPWCHMPWLQPGIKGREGIHGLTKEFPFAYKLNSKSALKKIYPDAVPGMSWGTAFYNAYACQDLEKIFGTPDQEKTSPDFFWNKEQGFHDGYLSFKLLFTTASFPLLKDSYQWWANVSHDFKPFRYLRKIFHLQMDIALKEKKFFDALPDYPLPHPMKKIGKDHDYWLMFTYYFDPELDPSTSSLPANLPKGLLKMRPLGVQYGLELGQTIIFPGGINNHDFDIPEKKLFRLNGPADNSSSSCFSCHTTAGTDLQSAPGILQTKDFLTIKEKFYSLEKYLLDFNKQLELSKQNQEKFHPSSP